jgi:hypothetical protein
VWQQIVIRRVSFSDGICPTKTLVRDEVTRSTRNLNREFISCTKALIGAVTCTARGLISELILLKSQSWWDGNKRHKQADTA